MVKIKAVDMEDCLIDIAHLNLLLDTHFFKLTLKMTPMIDTLLMLKTELCSQVTVMGTPLVRSSMTTRWKIEICQIITIPKKTAVGWGQL